LLWVWTRSPEHIRIGRDTEKRILAEAKEMSQEYVPDIPLVEAADIRHKILRVATAIAGRTYSTTDGVHLDVKLEHVAAAVDVMNTLYKAPGLDYYGFSDDRASLLITDEQMEELREDIKLAYPDAWETAARWMLRTNVFNKSLMYTTLNLSKTQVDKLLGFLNASAKEMGEIVTRVSILLKSDTQTDIPKPEWEGLYKMLHGLWMFWDRASWAIIERDTGAEWIKEARADPEFKKYYKLRMRYDELRRLVK